MDYKSRLNGMKKRWAESKADYESMGGGQKVPASIYVAQLKGCVLHEGKDSGKLSIKRSYLILDGEHKGVTITDYSGLETDRGFAFARMFIDVMGYEQPTDPSQLPEILAAIDGEKPTVKIEVSHKDDRQNVWIQSVVVNGEQAEAAAEEAEEATEEAPAEEAEEAAEEAEVDPALQALKEFCIGSDIKFSEDDDVDALKERIDEYEFEESTLTDEEKETLTSNGLESCIIKPAPKASAKKAASAPVSNGKKATPAAPLKKATGNGKVNSLKKKK